MLNAKPIIDTPCCRLGLGVNAGAVILPVYVPAEKLTEAAACDWIANALVGQSIQYHEGFLMMDRSDTGSGLPAKERQRLHALARRMWIACELGLVHLFSRKVGACHYQYVAVRSASSLTPPEIRTRLRSVGPRSPVRSNSAH